MIKKPPRDSTPSKIKKLPSGKKEIFRYAEKFIDMNVLFKDGKPKIKDLTKYKIKKIRKSLKIMADSAGGIHFLERDFIPMKKTARLKKYNRSIGSPEWIAGVTINGGTKVNTNIKFTKALQLQYIRGADLFTSAALDASTSSALKKSIKKHSKRIEREEFTYIGSNGNFIMPSYSKGYTPTESVIEKSLHLLEKYNGMFDRGEYRTNGRLAAKMEDWGFSLTWKNKNV